MNMCPLLSNAESTISCKGDECAWYSENDCAVNKMAKSLKYMTDGDNYNLYNVYSELGNVVSAVEDIKK